MELVVLMLIGLIACLLPLLLWQRDEVRFWRKQSEGWKTIAEERNALIERNRRAAVDNLEFADRILNSWKRFRYAILRDGQPVAELTDASLARMTLVMFQSNEEANGNSQHVWTMEGE